MKKFKLKLGLLIIAAIFMCGDIAFAGLSATIGDKNDDGEYRAKVEDGVFTFAQDTGLKFPYSSGTTSETLTAAQSGTTYVTTHSGGIPVLTLPAAALGMEFTFVAGTAQYLTVNPNGTDTIKYLTLAAGDSITSAGAIGDSVTLFCVTANEWVVKAMKGSWTDSN